MQTLAFRVACSKLAESGGKAQREKTLWVSEDANGNTRVKLNIELSRDFMQHVKDYAMEQTT